MTDTLNRRMIIDDRLESYKSFFDHAWAGRIIELAQGTKLDPSVFNLCVNWKAVANAHVLPWFTMNCVSNFAKGLLAAHEPLGRRLVDAFAVRLPAELGDSIRNMQRKKLAEVIRRIGTQIHETVDQAKNLDEVSPKDFWKRFLEDPASHELKLSLWGSERVCYSGIYHTYENFVRQSIELAKGSKTGRGFSELAKDADGTMGKGIADSCLLEPQIKIARLVRNALAHNGGEETNQLKAVSHGIPVEDGVLQVMPLHTHQLFSLLKDRAYRVAEAAVALPGMKWESLMPASRFNHLPLDVAAIPPAAPVAGGRNGHRTGTLRHAGRRACGRQTNSGRLPDAPRRGSGSPDYSRPAMRTAHSARSKPEA